MIVYDRDADRIYSFTDWASVMRSVEGSIGTYLDDNHVTECVIKELGEKLGGLADRPYIPIVINDLIITIYRWEIDPFNPIHKVLSKCYETADDTLKCDIMSLFTNPR